MSDLHEKVLAPQNRVFSSGDTVQWFEVKPGKFYASISGWAGAISASLLGAVFYSHTDLRGLREVTSDYPRN